MMVANVVRYNLKRSGGLKVPILGVTHQD